MPQADDKFVLHTRCVDEQTDTHVERLNAMTDKGRAIKAETFFRYVDRERISRELNYAYGRFERGVRLAKDYHVQFFRSNWRGKPCYYLVWSAIEYVFVSKSDHRELLRG